MNNLGLLLESKGDYAGAELLYRRALEARERILAQRAADEDPDLVSIVGKPQIKRSKIGAFTDP